MTPRLVIFLLTLFANCTLFTVPAFAGATEPGSFYVKAFALNVRSGPDPTEPSVGHIYRRERVDVYEVEGRWARITGFYTQPDSSDLVANWVSAPYLGSLRPKQLLQPKVPTDPRIKGLPKYGEHGISEDDLRILYAGAHYYLNTGQCTSIEFGDKSFKLAKTFYVNCASDRHVFFTAKDIGL